MKVIIYWIYNVMCEVLPRFLQRWVKDGAVVTHSSSLCSSPHGLTLVSSVLSSVSPTHTVSARSLHALHTRDRVVLPSTTVKYTIKKVIWPYIFITNYLMDAVSTLNLILLSGWSYPVETLIKININSYKMIIINDNNIRVSTHKNSKI